MAYFNSIILILLTVISTKTFSQVSSEISGATLFKTNCAVCHSIGKGKLVGPDLKGVNDRRKEAWLLKWIKSSQSLIKSGDQEAVAINNEFNKLAMTEFSSFTDEQIKAILEYIKIEGNGVAVTSVAAPALTNSNEKTSEQRGLSLTNILLLALSIVMLIIIFMLTRTIGILTEELKDYYDNDKAFFKK